MATSFRAVQVRAKSKSLPVAVRERLVMEERCLSSAGRYAYGSEARLVAISQQLEKATGCNSGAHGAVFVSGVRFGCNALLPTDLPRCRLTSRRSGAGC